MAGSKKYDRGGDNKRPENKREALTDANKKNIIAQCKQSKWGTVKEAIAGIVERQTYYKYRRDDPDFAEVMDILLHAKEEDRKDIAEITLMENMEKGKMNVPNMFFLKTKAKDRGYTERHEIKQEQEPEKLEIQYFSPDALPEDKTRRLDAEDVEYKEINKEDNDNTDN